MAVHYRDIAVEKSQLVRDVDALEGVAVRSGTGDMAAYNSPGGSEIDPYPVDPGKWIDLNTATNRKWWANVFESNTTITADGSAVPRPWKYMRLFAYGSTSRTYSALIINHPLQPGEQIEISFYASQGADLTNSGSSSVSGGSSTSNSASEDQDICAQVLYYSVGSFTSRGSLEDFLHFPRGAANPRPTNEIGSGDILASTGTNVGAINGGWEYSTGRSDSSFTQADFTARAGDESKIGRLYAENVPDETGSSYTRFFRITIRNDTDHAAYLKIKPYNWNFTYEYYTYYDFRIKVISDSLKNTIGRGDDITHPKYLESPRIKNVSAYQHLNMTGRNFVNLGDPWPQPGYSSPGFTIAGLWSKGQGEVEVPIDERTQVISKNFYDAWTSYKTPIPVPFFSHNHSGTAEWMPIASMDSSESFTGNNASDPEQYAMRDKIRIMPYDGRLYSVTLRTQNPPEQTITVRLYKYNGNLPRQIGSTETFDTSASVNQIGSIVFDKGEGYRSSDENTVTGYIKYSDSENGSFSAGDVLMMRLDAGTVSLGEVMGTMVFLRADI